MSTLIVTFPGGKRVDAHYKGFTIRTDQSPRGGGDGTAPEPFDLFLASIATCAGIYVKGYCDARGLSSNGLGIEMHVERDRDGRRVARLVLDIQLPAGFPDTHRDAVVRVAELCAVKKHILQPPEFSIRAQPTPRDAEPGQEAGSRTAGARR